MKGAIVMDYQSLKEKIGTGWQTWNNDSVLSYVYMPEGIGIKLGIKDYKSARYLENALIGTSEEEGIVTPKAHSYDASYTELTLTWGDNEILVQTGIGDHDQVILITPIKQPLRCSSLIVKGISLWNRGGIIGAIILCGRLLWRRDAFSL